MDWLKEHVKFDSGLLDVSLFTLAGTPVTAATLVVFAVVILLTFLASHLIRKGLGKALRMRKITDEGTIEVAGRLLHYLVLATGLAVGLQTIGINLSALFAAGAVFAIGLGFAMQTIMQKFVSGVILLTERSIKPGDVLRVDQRVVRVLKMGIRATMYRLSYAVGVVYGADMKLVREELERAAREIQWRMQDKDPVILLTGFGSSSVDWEVSVWMDDPWKFNRAKSELNEAIWWRLKDAGIAIAFPQVDVHFDQPVLEAIRRAS